MKNSFDHPGTLIKRDIIPAGVTVTAAAKTLGVGRPALSNLLNGNAALSPEMALRLERAFGAKANELLKLQAAYDQSLAQAREPAIAVRAFAPRVVDVKAIQIEAWADRLETRAELAAFIRRLVNTTGRGLTQVDFPAFENSQRRGWDGEVVANYATPWVPLGKSGWEFGANKDPGKKAENDFSERLKLKASERRDSTFVFVTPRNWSSKDAWLKAKRALGEWKDVRAYDASDLEQWLEGSPSAQAWLGERLPLGGKDILTLDKCWSIWADVTEPPLSKALFGRAAERQGSKLADWLSREPEEVFTINAASKEEALGGLSCVLEGPEVAEKAPNAADRVLVVRTAEALEKVAATTAEAIIVLLTAEAQKASAGIHRRHHTIAITRRNVEDEPDLIFDLVNSETFRKGLADMGLNDDKIDRLRRESGRSQTVLRRRLSKVPEIKTPPWADDKEVAERLIPLMFVGAWDATSEADQAVLAAIAAGTHDDIEKTVACLGDTEQSPVWAVGRIRGVVSKVDALYAVQGRITATELNRFFDLAKLVLSETDPSLDLPDDQRWASNIYGKMRRHSSALREGICETLVLLAVHGNNLFKSRLGFDVEDRVNQLVRELMTPFDPVTWQSQRNDLPRYAEAAPETFLRMLEEDLDSSDPKVHALMQPALLSMMSSPSRSGLLWALEGLAWNPKWLPRIVIILADFSELKVSDNWANKPENSLLSIFRCWMPQTAASTDERIALLDALRRKHSSVAWTIYVDQFDVHSRIGHHSSKPRWRRDALGAGEVVTMGEMAKVQIDAVTKAIDWPTHTISTLSDLVERLEALGTEFQQRVWAKIDEWIAVGPSEEDKAQLREKIRSTTLTQRKKKKGGAKIRERAKATLDALRPTDVVLRHLWLLEKTWVRESADELEEEGFDFRKREERITKLRGEALAEIWKVEGYAGILRLCGLSEAPHMVGWNLAASVLDEAETRAFIRDAIATVGTPSENKLRQCLGGVFLKMEPDLRDDILKQALDQSNDGQVLSENQTTFLFCAAPFHGFTWDLVDDLPKELKRSYWKRVWPQKLFNDVTQPDVNRVVDELLDVERPRAAFFTVEMEFEHVQSLKLVRLLVECATVSSEPTGYYSMAKHDISEVFKLLSKRGDVPEDELARLEFLYIKALDHTEHGLKTLEGQLARLPELYVQALMMLYRRRDGGQDPGELRPSNDEQAADRASAAHTLLHKMRRLPGTDPSTGEVKPKELKTWITRAIELARECSREEVAENEIGQLLGRCPAGRDGVWPCEGVREALEDVGTPGLARGMIIGLYNARGAQWRGEGGSQERALAAKYRAWAAQLGMGYLFTTRLLYAIASDYDRDAERWDAHSEINHRLEH